MKMPSSQACDPLFESVCNGDETVVSVITIIDSPACGHILCVWCVCACVCVCVWGGGGGGLPWSR